MYVIDRYRSRGAALYRAAPTERRNVLTQPDPYHSPQYHVPPAPGGSRPALGWAWRVLLLVGLWPLASLLWTIHALLIRQEALGPLLARAFLNTGMEVGGAYVVPGIALIPSSLYALIRTIQAWGWPTLTRMAQANHALRHFRRASGWAILAFGGMVGWLFVWTLIN